MGVWGLCTYMTKNVPGGVYPINISKEIEKYKRENKNKKPVIIVDLFAIIKIIFKNDQTYIFGGRYNMYNEKAVKLYKTFSNLGARIIYVFDGPVKSEKIETRLNRSNKDYMDKLELLNILDEGIDLNACEKIYGGRVLNPFNQNFLDILSEYGELKMSLLNECDQEMTHLANELNALAVITSDTDFLIYEGDWKIWSSKDIDLDNLTTLEFNKSALRNKLSLSSHQMALFGTLVGNDIVTYDILKDYHSRYYAYFKFLQIAKDVKSILSPQKLSISDENFIRQKVLNENNENVGLEKIRISLDTYCWRNMINEINDDNITQISNDHKKRFVLFVLSEQNIFITGFFDDLSKGYFSSHADLTLPLSQRFLGIILKHKQNTNPKRVFYCKMSHEKPYEAIDGIPEYPNYELPPILTLLNKPYGEDESLDNLRLKLFCWQISSNLNSDIILSLQNHNNLIVTAVTIFYLFEKKQISENEADCLLLSFNFATDNDLNEVKVLNGRDTRLAFLFTIMYTQIYNCLVCVGLTNFCSLLTFDGLYFHHLRQKYRENVIPESILKSIENLRIYRSLL